MFPVVQKVIARASNRVIVGLPRCKCSRASLPFPAGRI